ncbi:hypothetical protein [uncultured Acetatifactor sp.]|uniref:hypothetical protein n=1 Tax=uncultured Acetatifactor sp. TaxID=1671927 RepID=UPI00262AD1EA|nr:hypothetical protein [uncultured Acetatifactor sp.]MCI8695812.1 hypothetical protein [Lachnospiraceae bacterium]
MRSDIWGLLGISPTGDRKAIRSAYAAQSRLHHPEEEPEYFVELNQAYKQALDFARTAGAGDADVNSREDGTGRENKGSAGNRGDREDRNSADGRRVERNRKGEEDRNGRYREGAGDTGDRDDQEDKGSSESVKSYDTESGRIHSGVENKEKQSAQMHDSAGDERKESAQIRDSIGDEKKESAQVHDSAGDEEENGTTHKLNRAKSEDRQESAAETNDTGKDDGEKESAKATGGIVGSGSRQESTASSYNNEEDEDKQKSTPATAGSPEATTERESASTDARENELSLLERLADAQQKAIQQSMDTGALHEFIALFTNPKQAKNADAWRRFFLSETFLGEQYAEGFARGLYAYLMEQEVCPHDNLPMALLQELAIAYALVPHFAGEEYREGMKYPKEWYKVSVEQTFPARKQVAEIFNRQGWDCDLKSMTRRMLKQPANKVRHNAFSDYLDLKEMGRQGQLTEAEKETWQHILGLGQVHYLYERNGKQLGSADYESRSECVVKLYVQWLKDEGLPECVLKFLYQKFAFRELEHSSTKGLYGALKEQVLRQLPQVEELLFGQDGLEQKATKVYRVCSRIINDNQNNYEKSIYEETPEIRERVEALFAMPEWKELQGDRGLFDKLCGGAQRLVMPRSLAEGLIRYLQQGDFPEPRCTELLESLLRSLATARMCREIDYRFRVPVPDVDMDDLEGNGDFWQYYLMRGFGFRHSRIRGAWEDGYLYEMDGECYLPAYIRYLYAPSRVWQRAFTGFCQETESIPEPVSAVCALPDGRVLRVEFHYHYCLYFLEETPVLAPILSFAQLHRWALEHLQTGTDTGQDADGQTEGQVRDFFFLLAVTAIEDSERRAAEELIMQWLGKLPLYPQICPLLARLLAADNDRLPAGTRAVYYEEQERFCFRAVVSGEGIRIYRQMEFGWEDRIFRRAEFGWKEVPLSMEALGLGRSRVPAQALVGVSPVELPPVELSPEGVSPVGLSSEGLSPVELPPVGLSSEELSSEELSSEELSPEGLPSVGVSSAELENLARESLLLLRQPKPVLLATQNLEGMDVLQKTQAVLKAMGFPEGVEGYCVLRYGQERERRHDKVFYGALSPFGFPVGIHSPEYERSMRFHMDVSRTKIKEGKRYVGRFGWGFKYSHQSDFWPLCVYQGDSGTYYADGTVRMYRAQSLDKLLADWLKPELEGVTEVEAYGGLLTVSRLDHRLEYCYGEKDFQDSVHGTGQTVADFFTVFGGYRLWETFARWMDAALGKGLPDWVNVLTIGQALGKEEGEGSILSLTGCYVEEVNLDLLELQERLGADSREDFQEEEERERPAGGQGEWEQPNAQQAALAESMPEYREYPLEAPRLVWGKGLAVHMVSQSLWDAARWYLEERPGEGAELLRNRRIRVEIAD